MAVPPRRRGYYASSYETSSTECVDRVLLLLYDKNKLGHSLSQSWTHALGTCRTVGCAIILLFVYRIGSHSGTRYLPGHIQGSIRRSSYPRAPEPDPRHPQTLARKWHRCSFCGSRKLRWRCRIRRRCCQGSLSKSRGGSRWCPSRQRLQEQRTTSQRGLRNTQQYPWRDVPHCGTPDQLPPALVCSSSCKVDT